MCAPHLPIHPCYLLEQTVDRRIPVLFVNLPLPNQLKCLSAKIRSNFSGGENCTKQQYDFPSMHSGVQGVVREVWRGLRGRAGREKLNTSFLFNFNLENLEHFEQHGNMSCWNASLGIYRQCWYFPRSFAQKRDMRPMEESRNSS